MIASKDRKYLYNHWIIVCCRFILSKPFAKKSDLKQNIIVNRMCHPSQQQQIYVQISINVLNWKYRLLLFFQTKILSESSVSTNTFYILRYELQIARFDQKLFVKETQRNHLNLGWNNFKWVFPSCQNGF